MNVSRRRARPVRQQIERVYLLGPDLRTLGGFETQLMLLAAGLRACHVEVDVFIREPVRASHPYWQRMQAAGARLHAPSRWRAGLVSLPEKLYPAGFRLLSLILLPVMILTAALDAAVQRRSLRRAWQGVGGRWRRLLAPWEDFDGLTWSMELMLDAAGRLRLPDIVDVQHSLLPAGLAYARRRGWLAVYTEHGAPTEEFQAIWAGLRPVINDAALIIGRAQASLDGLRRICSATAPGVVVPQAVLTQPDEGQVRACLPPANGPVVVGVLSRLSREKGLWVLLDAYHQLIASGLEVGLALAGDGPLRTEMEAWASQGSYGSRVRFLGAYRNDALGPILAQMHIVAHPSLTDSRPMAVLEAMAWGRPVVASRVGGVAEIIEDEVSGLLVPAADSLALARALERLVVDPALRERLGRAARDRFLAGSFNANNMVSATLAAYKLALNTNVAAQAG